MSLEGQVSSHFETDVLQFFYHVQRLDHSEADFPF
jgi:hypothetical protein